MSDFQSDGTGTRRSRLLAITVAVVALVVVAAGLFLVLRPDGFVGSETEATPSATPTATEAVAAPEETGPASPEPEEPAVPELASYTTNDGMLQFDYPAGWTIQPLSSPSKDNYDQWGEALEIVNEEGQTMAEVITDFPSGFVAVQGVPYFEFDYEPIPGLEDKDPTRGEAPAFVFHGLDQAAGFDADMAITGWGRVTDKESGVLPHGFEFTRDVSGAFFHRPIGPDTVLPVDPALAGTERLEAYMQTEEYQDIKKMMMSVRFLK